MAVGQSKRGNINVSLQFSFMPVFKKKKNVWKQTMASNIIMNFNEQVSDATDKLQMSHCLYCIASPLDCTTCCSFQAQAPKSFSVSSKVKKLVAGKEFLLMI